MYTEQLKAFGIHLKNLLLCRTFAQIRKMHLDHQTRGIYVKHYNYKFKVVESLILAEGAVPNKINWFTLVECNPVQRTPKRKVIQKVFGKSRTAIINDHKKTALNEIAKINAKHSR